MWGGGGEHTRIQTKLVTSLSMGRGQKKNTKKIKKYWNFPNRGGVLRGVNFQNKIKNVALK
jgi:hypothetical protein